MQARWMVGVVSVSMVCGALAVCAAEQNGATATKAGSTASSTTAQRATSPAQAESLLQGTVAALDVSTVPPTLKVAGEGGRLTTLALDPKTTTLSKDGQELRWDQRTPGDIASALKTGQAVKVRYSHLGARDVAKSIQVVQAAKPASTTPGSSASN